VKFLTAIIVVCILVIISLLTTTATAEPTYPSATYQGKTAKWWAKRAVQARKDANARGRTIKIHQKANRQRVSLGSSGVTHAFLCIHSFEGAWNSATGNGYYGGMQMDMSFQRAYGREFLDNLGTADNWPPFIQMAVAMRAYYSGRGFGPWPNTRLSCGV